MAEPARQQYEESVFCDESHIGRIVDVLKAVAHPVRLRIVAVLREGELNVTGLAEVLQLHQAIISQQLRILRMGGLVDVSRRGGFAVYRLAEPQLQDLLRCMEGCAKR